MRSLAAEALAVREPTAKVEAVAALGARLDAGAEIADTPRVFALPLEPGRPRRPRLVGARALPRRSLHRSAGRNALLHAVAHIEFNAINLALDAVVRFADLPPRFYRDWLGVAREEARHFMLVNNLLTGRGVRYGDLDAHDGLWQVARSTADDPLARMALVPRLLEARGLDVTPGMRARLAGAGDHQAAAVLDVILAEEIGHVAIGNHWYHHLCVARGVDPATEFERLRIARGAPGLHPPFNLEARAAAGFTADEISAFAAANAASRQRAGGNPAGRPASPTPLPSTAGEEDHAPVTAARGKHAGSESA